MAEYAPMSSPEGDWAILVSSLPAVSVVSHMGFGEDPIIRCLIIDSSDNVSTLPRDRARFSKPSGPMPQIVFILGCTTKSMGMLSIHPIQASSTVLRYAPWVLGIQETPWVSYDVCLCFYEKLAIAPCSSSQSSRTVINCVITRRFRIFLVRRRSFSCPSTFLKLV